MEQEGFAGFPGAGPLPLQPYGFSMGLWGHCHCILTTLVFSITFKQWEILLLIVAAEIKFEFKKRLLAKKNTKKCRNK